MMQCIGAAHLAGIPLTIPQAIRDLAVALQADGVATLGTLVDIVGQPPDVTDGEAWTGWWDDLEREPITFPDHNVSSCLHCRHGVVNRFWRQYLETVERNHYIRNLLFLNQIQSSMLNDVCSMLQEDASLLLSSAAADIQASLMASFENYRGLLDSIHVVPS